MAAEAKHIASASAPLSVHRRTQTTRNPLRMAMMKRTARVMTKRRVQKRRSWKRKLWGLAKVLRCRSVRSRLLSRKPRNV